MNSWESACHLRNLTSQVFETARKWNDHLGANPASGILLHEKVPVREKPTRLASSAVQTVAGQS
jgi:hypothetical protein